MWSISGSVSHRYSTDTQELDSTQKSGSTSEASDSDSETAEERMAGGELIMPWHIQDTAPQPRGKGENQLIVELSSEEVSMWMNNRGMNPEPHDPTHHILCHTLILTPVGWRNGQTRNKTSENTSH